MNQEKNQTDMDMSQQTSIKINQSKLENSVEISQTSPTEKKAIETAWEPKPNPCQGFKIDPLTKLHLCQTCPYHKYRNKEKPWVGKGKE